MYETQIIGLKYKNLRMFSFSKSLMVSKIKNTAYQDKIKNRQNFIFIYNNIHVKYYYKLHNNFEFLFHN